MCVSWLSLNRMSHQSDSQFGTSSTFQVHPLPLPDSHPYSGLTAHCVFMTPWESAWLLQLQLKGHFLCEASHNAPKHQCHLLRIPTAFTRAQVVALMATWLLVWSLVCLCAALPQSPHQLVRPFMIGTMLYSSQHTPSTQPHAGYSESLLSETPGRQLIGRWINH